MVNNVGYLNHGVGELDPDRHMPRVADCCRRCGEPADDGEWVDEYYMCPDCSEEFGEMEGYSSYETL